MVESQHASAPSQARVYGQILVSNDMPWHMEFILDGLEESKIRGIGQDEPARYLDPKSLFPFNPKPVSRG